MKWSNVVEKEDFAYATPYNFLSYQKKKKTYQHVIKKNY